MEQNNFKTNKIIIEAPGCPDISAYPIRLSVKKSTNEGPTDPVEYIYEQEIGFSFQYEVQPGFEPIIIESMAPNSVSPVIKQAIRISGSGFGSNKNHLNVIMKKTGSSNNEEKKLKVLRITDSLLTVGFPGCLPGTYSISIHKEQVTETGTIKSSSIVLEGSPDANILTAKVSIQSISPLTGSPYGGTELTITGSNFSPEAL